jgi:hypothetical protein
VCVRPANAFIAVILYRTIQYMAAVEQQTDACYVMIHMDAQSKRKRHCSVVRVESNKASSCDAMDENECMLPYCKFSVHLGSWILVLTFVYLRLDLNNCIVQKMTKDIYDDVIQETHNH